MNKIAICVIIIIVLVLVYWYLMKRSAAAIPTSTPLPASTPSASTPGAFFGQYPGNASINDMGNGTLTVIQNSTAYPGTYSGNNISVNYGGTTGTLTGTFIAPNMIWSNNTVWTKLN